MRRKLNNEKKNKIIEKSSENISNIDKAEFLKSTKE